MNYLLYFAVMLPFQLALVTGTLLLIRRFTQPVDPPPWPKVAGYVLLLMLAVNLLALFPGVAFLGLIVWLIGLKRLSGLDVIPTFIMAFGLGVVVFAAMFFAARQLNVPLGAGPSQ